MHPSPAPSRRKNRHYSLATYILLRGITLLVRTGNRSQRRPWLHKLLAPTRLDHGDTLLMCLSCSQVVYAFLMMPQVGGLISMHTPSSTPEGERGG